MSLCWFSGRGLFAKQNCTSTSDTVCDVIAGHFCTDPIEDEDEDEECRSARRHSDCEPGHRVKEPGERNSSHTVTTSTARGGVAGY